MKWTCLEALEAGEGRKGRDAGIRDGDAGRDVEAGQGLDASQVVLQTRDGVAVNKGGRAAEIMGLGLTSTALSVRFRQKLSESSSSSGSDRSDRRLQREKRRPLIRACMYPETAPPWSTHYLSRRSMFIARFRRRSPVKDVKCLRTLNKGVKLFASTAQSVSWAHALRKASRMIRTNVCDGPACRACPAPPAARSRSVQPSS